MAEISVKSVTIQPDVMLPGLENTTELQIRPLEAMTLFSVANRLLRFKFPPHRDYDLHLQILGKGLLFPQLSRNQLAMLPIKTIELLAQMVAEVSIQQLHPQRLPHQQAMDCLLTMIIAVEESRQFAMESLVSEDLALLEAHQQGSLHGYFFKPSKDWELLAHVLQTQGFQTGLAGHDPQSVDLHLAYWLCRRLTVCFPWSGILNLFPVEYAETFPYLFRLYRIYQNLLEKEKALDDGSVAPARLLENWLGRIEEWEKNEFPIFSQQAHIPAPVSVMVLAEGSTEELLLPALAQALDTDLDREGILIQPVGGKNQMLQQYVNYSEYLSVPIIVLMDKDAAPLLPDLNYYRREQDQIFILEEGEFEDIYALELIVKTVNEQYMPGKPLTLKMLKDAEAENDSRVKTLQYLWAELGLGLFDKVNFAQAMARTIREEKRLSPPMEQLMRTIIAAKQANAALQN